MIDAEARATLRAVRATGVALVGGIVAYGAVVAVLLGGGRFSVPAPSLAGMLIPLAGLFTLATVVSAPFLEEVVRRLPHGVDRSEALRRFSGAAILGLAIREGAALFALTAALVTGSLAWGLGLASLACLGMLTAWPTEDKLRRHLRDTP